jgi:hypothetical protein
VFTDSDKSHPKILRVKPVQWSIFYNIFNMEVGTKYLFETIFQELTTMPWTPWSVNCGEKLYHRMALHFVFNILDPPMTHGWVIGSNGTMIWRDENYVPNWLSSGFLPVSGLRNLRPSLVQFVLRYCSIALGCGAPVLAALFEHWEGKAELHDRRIFPDPKLPREYMPMGDGTISVIY